MPSSPNSRSKGKSVADIHARWSQARLRPSSSFTNVQPEVLSGDAEPRSPIEKVQAFREDQQVKRMNDLAIAQAESEMELEQVELEARRIEAEAKIEESKSRLAELRQSLKSGNSDQNQLTLVLLEMLEKQNSGNDIGKYFENMGKVMSEAMAQLRDEIKSRNVEPDVDPIDKLNQNMQAIVALKAVMAELSPVPEERPREFSDAEKDIDTTIRLHQIEMDHQARMFELNMKKAEWDERAQLERRKLEVDESRAKMFGDGLSHLANNFQPIMQELANAAINSRAATPAEPAPVATAPMYVATPAPVNGNGVHEQVLGEQQEENKPFDYTCDNCGEVTRIVYPTSHFECQGCGLQKDVDWTEDG